ncbi:MAG: hypothetical protein D8M59_14670 [Planctomycetes bacterium]|nr:hypothetical protein [Planctomycetota bacterium]NOG53351.1 hypothetical protein [Planctomycetota bacterium]
MDTAATFEIPPQAWYTHLLLENPWPFAGILAAIALVSLATGLMRGASIKRWGVPTVISTTLAIAVYALAQTVTTTAERLTQMTMLMVESAVAGTPEDIRPLLADNFDVYVGTYRSRWGPDGFLARIPAIPQLVRSNHVREVRAAVVDSRGTIAVSVFDQTTIPAISGQLTPNRWRCVWSRQPDGSWELAQLRWESWGLGQTPPTGLLTSFGTSGGG